MTAIMVLLGIFLLLVPLPADASVTYQFLGITAALPPDPFHPNGVPSHVETFTVTAPTFLPVPVSAPFQPTFLQIAAPDACPACLPGVGVFLSEQTFGLFAAPISAALVDFDDVVNVGYTYFFLPGAFATLGLHTTAQFDAVHGALGPFENIGILIVTAVPGPATLVLLGAGLGVALWRARPVRCCPLPGQRQGDLAS